MLLKEAIETQRLNNNKIDILELLWIKISDNHFDEKYYLEKIEKLEKWDYFFSDLDWTFFRWMLSKETFTLFVKFVKKQDLLTFDTQKFKEFLDDNLYFDELEKKAYNKTIAYNDYINAWTFLLFKYKDLIVWEEFLYYIKQNFKKREKVNPFRFSFAKIKEVLESWANFVFVSWAPDFTLEIYLELLKTYIDKELWKNYDNKIHAFWTYMWLKDMTCIWLFWLNYKDKFIKRLNETWIINKVIWWMWDTKSDYWISINLDDNSNFYFVNPEQWVIENFENLSKKSINYKFIFERKDMIIDMKLEDINIINLK